MDLPTLDETCRAGFSATRAAAFILFAVTAGAFVAASLVAFLRPDHPLQRLLAPLTRRLAATVALALVAAPLERIPGVALPLDVAVLAGLCAYWWTFIAGQLLSPTSPLRRKAAAAYPSDGDAGSGY